MEGRGAYDVMPWAESKGGEFSGAGVGNGMEGC